MLYGSVQCWRAGFKERQGRTACQIRDGHRCSGTKRELIGRGGEAEHRTPRRNAVFQLETLVLPDNQFRGV